ncbi:HAD family hydrolase [Streptomyces acidiscabies]|uniref:Haloacid dehalogenase-like hydrolase n=1 Tax=Streptomyces acidiscabies TaxID=42234 RepID=A0AAP6EHL2_9ACTN|nr:haloacid dehalogenase-like hydrolase [Streptomyces acidiscabies]MBZ3913287.1 haloacid dehalogenase-like hydrolase [Streptomyces acidiscabies]MDX2963287.1 haloacid dehalogenase-like hydrolase [Streptomyces acidiscabies]MDX3021495.1 haloacid dehalogenase-like hydrolase [Streptomyces acidiscabies]MDX3790254.1 haloacid dehalogenase-like hydrolase [Streptomyces acidiscabies]
MKDTWNMLRLAVLDLDGTLVPGFAALAMTEALLDVPGADPAAARAAIAAIHSYQAREIDHEECARRFHAGYAATVRGVPPQALDRAGRLAWEQVGRELHPFVRDLIALLRARGLTVCLLSGSPHQAVRQAATDLGIDPDRAWGMTFATGTGPALGLRGAKRAVLRRVEAATPVDWAHSFALGDSASDIEVLALAGHPVAFEPDPQLRTAALANGWPMADRDTVLVETRRALTASADHG